MKKEIEKYKLICIANDKEVIKIFGGSLKSIDEYIYKNNIYDINDLSKVVPNNNFYSKMEFKIIYNYKKETREKTILYKDEIRYNIEDRMNYIKNKFFNNSTFQQRFLDKFVYPILKIPNDIKLKQFAKNLIIYPCKNGNFERFLNTYTDKYKKITEKELQQMTSSEQTEIAEQNYIKVYKDYKILRDIYVFALGKKRNAEILDFTKFAKFTNEFDELQAHDQNPDMGIRYPKYYIRDDEEIKENKPKEKILKKKRKKRTYTDENQISMFDI